MQVVSEIKLIKGVMTKSLYADRETIGSIALNASKLNERVCVGDMARELMPQLVEDLNKAILSNPFENQPFFITIHEKKDLLLTNVIKRRVVVSAFRPYPEPATSVFWTDPKNGEVRFCWSLPHTSEFYNYLFNAYKYCKDQIKDIVAYNKECMAHFGFYRIGMNEKNIPIYKPIPNFKDRRMNVS